MLIPILFLLVNLGAMFVAPFVAYHATGSMEWACLVGSAPLLMNGYVLLTLWSICRRQRKGHIGSEMGALPFIWVFLLTPIAVVWALITTVLAFVL